MLKKYVLPLLLLLNIITAYNTFKPIYKVDPELEFYLTMFSFALENNCYYKEYDHPNQFIMEFKDLDNYAVLGRCGRGISRRVIQINSQTWEYLSNDGKLDLLFHEMSHCFLNVDHVDQPGHYMNANDQNLKWYVVAFQTIEVMHSRCTKWKPRN